MQLLVLLYTYHKTTYLNFLRGFGKHTRMICDKGYKKTTYATKTSDVIAPFTI